MKDKWSYSAMPEGLGKTRGVDPYCSTEHLTELLGVAKEKSRLFLFKFFS